MADPVSARAQWTAAKATLPEVPWLAQIDFVIQSDTLEMQRQAATLDLRPVSLTDGQVDDIVAFLNSLTGVSALERPLGRPASVPSGLPVD